MTKKLNVDKLCEVCLKILRTRVEIITKMAEISPKLTLIAEPRRFGNKVKKALGIDASAQAIFAADLQKYFPQIIVRGEEDFDDESLDLRNPKWKDKKFAIVDMVDGSDLLERGLSNWCSAVTFFEPQADPGKRILAAFVGMPNGETYYSKNNSDDVLVEVKEKENRHHIKETLPPLSKISKQHLQTELKNASVAFYGQKVSSLLSIMNRNPTDGIETLLDYVYKAEIEQNFKIKAKINANKKLKLEETPIDFRIYTLNGIPIVVKLIDYRVKEIRKIDAVFNIKGQRPHDVVPGVYLAMKAGAVVRNLEKNRDMTKEDLEDALMQPAKSKLIYVIASNRKLAMKIEELLLPLIEDRKQPASNVTSL